jgi:hypothetical protein
VSTAVRILPTTGRGWLSTRCPPLQAFACRVEWVLMGTSPPTEMGDDSDDSEWG